MPLSRVFHPFLFAIWPVLFLYGQNQDEIDSLWPILTWSLAMVGGALVLFVAFYRLCRQPHQAGVSTTAFVGSYYAYPFLVSALPQTWQSQRQELVALATLLLGLGLVVARVLRSRASWAQATRILNVVAVAAVLQAFVPIVWGWFGTPSLETPKVARALGTTRLSAEPRDVYYIILDAYSRQDVLSHYYGFDNSDFLEGLEKMGFFVAGQSTSNYAMTMLSLPSSLNMAHLLELDPSLDPKGRINRPRHRDWIRESAVFWEFKDLGYQFHLISGSFRASSSSPLVDTRYSCETLSDFGVLLIQNSLLRVLQKPLVRERRRRQILCQYDTLEHVVSLDGPKFVFAHIVSPHGPWLFRRDGSPPDRSQDFSLGGDHADRALYVEQIMFNNSRLLALMKKIARVRPEPIVILQADHGPDYLLKTAGQGKKMTRMSEAKALARLRPGEPLSVHAYERMSIFNAYRFPAGGGDRLYSTITPVNSFPVLFDYYFGGSFGLREDIAYLSFYRRPYRMWDVSDLVRAVAKRPPQVPNQF